MNRLLTIVFLSVMTPLASSAATSDDAHHPVARDYYEAGFPRLIVLQTPREGVLQNRSPYNSSVRSYTNDRGGNPYDTRSGLPYGTSPAEADNMIIVRPRKEVPYIAINPWEPITDRTIEELERNYPWLRRTDSIRDDLIIARNQYLRERGYVSTVRGFRNESPGVAGAARSSNRQQVYTARPGAGAQQRQAADPQLVIMASNTAESERIAAERLKPESVIRRSNDSE